MGPLTAEKAKPALPFAGSYRLIDIPLSNVTHSDIADVWVVEQFQPHFLNEHVANGRPWDLDRTYGGLRLLPPYEGDDGEGGCEVVVHVFPRTARNKAALHRPGGRERGARCAGEHHYCRRRRQKGAASVVGGAARSYYQNQGRPRACN